MANSNNFFNLKDLPISDYPSNYIPRDAEIFIGIDYAKEDGDCTVKGFRDKDGAFHIQGVEHSIK